ncbi:MAG TPA: Spy/CpxP family protein refolding chaperone [Rhizomicrobium sp.]|jgi:hypothetical protein
MRKALVPMLASLAVCGAATMSLIATNAGAEASPKKPVMMALVAPGQTLLEDDNAPGPRTFRGPSPAEIATGMKRMCDDQYAREAGRMAYLEARLSLTPAEQPLFAHWKAIRLDIAKHRATDCGQHAVRHEHVALTPVDHMGREQDFLKKRLADLDAERPVLASLYKALTPPQREILAPPAFPARPGMTPDRGILRPAPMGGGAFPPPPPL